MLYAERDILGEGAGRTGNKRHPQVQWGDSCPSKTRPSPGRAVLLDASSQDMDQALCTEVGLCDSLLPVSGRESSVGHVPQSRLGSRCTDFSVLSSSICWPM